MNLKTILLLFSMIFLAACKLGEVPFNFVEKEPDKIEELKKEIKEAKEQLEKPKDSVEGGRLVKKILRLQNDLITEMREKRHDLEDELQAVDNKESCEKVIQQIKKLEKDMEEAVKGSTNKLKSDSPITGSCTEIGYNKISDDFPW